MTWTVSADAWDSKASSMQFINLQTVERVDWEIHGIVEVDSSQLSKSIWTTTRVKSSRIEMDFSEDGSYR